MSLAENRLPPTDAIPAKVLDQLVPLATGPITLEGARSLLGIADPRLLDSLLDDVLSGRAAEALA